MDEKQELVERAEFFAQTKSIEQTLNLPTAPNGKDITQDIKSALNEQETPNKKDEKAIKKKVRKIWGNYRNNVLNSIDLENYKKFCELEEMKAETDKKLAKIKREKEKEEAQHWLEMHKGNLEEIGYNTASMPNKYFYAKDRYIHYINNTMKRIPKWTWYILCGVMGIGIMVLMALGISKLW